MGPTSTSCTLCPAMLARAAVARHMETVHCVQGGAAMVKVFEERGQVEGTAREVLDILDRLGKLGGRSEGRKAMVDPFKELMEFVESGPDIRPEQGPATGKSYETKVKVEQETAESMEIEVKTEPETEVNVSSIFDKYKFLHAKKEDDVTMEIEVKTEPEADVLSILDRYKNIEDNKVTMEEAACQDVKVEEVKEEHDEEVTGDAVKVIKSDIKPELAATKKVQKSADCDKCDKKFKNSYNLKQHYTLHTGETPYGCKECPLKFPNQGALMRHRQKIHTKPTN